jgi:rhamnose transport system permease protein
VAASAFFLHALPWGRAVYAVGSSPSAARLAGLPTRRIVVAAFVISGVCAGIAGFLSAARFGYVGPDSGSGLELQSIAAAVVGGVAILGGGGGPLGAALGALLLGMIANALAILAIPGTYLEAITGVAILAAIVIQFALRDGNVLRRSKPRGGRP